MNPEPHISGSAQNDIAHALEWSFENFGAAAEARYSALIAAAIAHAAQDTNALGFKKRAELPGDVSVGTSPRASCTAPAVGSASHDTSSSVAGLVISSRSLACSTRPRTQP